MNNNAPTHRHTIVCTKAQDEVKKEKIILFFYFIAIVGLLRCVCMCHLVLFWWIEIIVLYTEQQQKHIKYIL